MSKYSERSCCNVNAYKISTVDCNRSTEEDEEKNYLHNGNSTKKNDKKNCTSILHLTQMVIYKYLE